MKFITGIVFGILMVIFIFQNIDIVVINFLFWSLSISRALMIFLVFLMGIVLGTILRSINLGKKSPHPKLEADLDRSNSV
ncbi:MAG: LapA family protein [Candidatus Aminicenantes bacterium]|nr:LapA family protein [Candidatus Aminicenantes bacterium]